MSNEQLSPGGAPQDAGGVEKGVNQDQVSFESYNKLLSQKKKRDEEMSVLRQQLEALESEKKEKLEVELKQKEDYRKLVELRDKELEKTKAEATEYKKKLEIGLKLDGFLKTLNADISDKYFGLIDLEKVVLDPNTSRPDQASLEKLAEDFRTQYPEIVAPKSQAKLPNTAASGSSPMTIEEWKKLPLAKKRESLHAVYEKLKSGS